MKEETKVLGSLLSEIKILKKQKLDEKIAMMRHDTDGGFWEFCKYLFPNFFHDDQTERIRYATILHNCGRWTLTGDAKYRKYRKVMVNIFPRFAKSFMLTIWCLWLLWQFPKGSIMRNAHDATLAEKFSRDLRNMIDGNNDDAEDVKNLISVANKIKAIAPKLVLSKDKKSLECWALSGAKDVSYFCAGVKGGITGKGCDLAMVLDDPVKDPEKAMSPTFSDDLLTWYLTVHRARQDRDSLAFGCEVIVMARWSDDDLCSKLLEAEDDWYEVNFDIEDENGNSSCESIVSTEKMLEMKRGFVNTGRIKWWDALYRQKVAGIGKKLFPRENLLRFDPEERDFSDKNRFQKIAFVDIADEGTDSLSAPIGCFDIATGDVFVTDVVFTKLESEKSILLVAKALLDNEVEVVCFESNNGGKYYGELVKNAVLGIVAEDESKKAVANNIIYEYARTSANKETKILVYSSIVLAKVYFVEDSLVANGSDYYFFIRELVSHQKEKKNLHDDAADSICSMVKRFGAGGSFDLF